MYKTEPMKKYAIFLRFVVFVLLLNPAIRSQAQGNDTLNRLFPQYKAGAPGYAIGITQSGKLIYQRYEGLANVTYPTHLDSNSVFDVGSVSKQFTAACIALLQFQGKLSVDDPITKYLTDFPVVYRKVHISNLIYHTGGIRSWEMLEMLCGRNPEKGYYTNDMIISLLKKQQGLNFEPGEKYLYSNAGYILLAAIIQKVSGKSLKDFAAENIFKPLGMKHTFFVDDQQELYPHKVTGYRRNDDGTLYEVINHNNSYGGGNLHTTIGDLAKWESNYFNNRLGYGDKLIKLLLTKGKLNNGKPIGYGFGVEMEQYKDYQVISHTGYWPGFRTRMLVIPELAYAVTFITNSSDDIHTDQTAFDIAEAYSPELFKNKMAAKTIAPTVPTVLRKPIAFKPATKQRQAALIGTYYSTELNKAFRVISVNGKLALQIDGDTLEIKQMGAGIYTFQDAMIIKFSGEGFSLDVGQDLRGLAFVKVKLLN